MSWSRRSFLTSLSTTALVLSLDEVLALAAPQNPQSTPQLGPRPAYNAVPRPAPLGRTARARKVIEKDGTIRGGAKLVKKATKRVTG